MVEAVETGSIESIDRNYVEGAAIIRLGGGRSFELEASHRMSEFWLKMMQTLAADPERNHLTVVYNPQTRRVIALYPAVFRNIEGLAAATKGDRLEVFVLRSPSLYFIRTTRPNYAEMRVVLEAATKTRAEALIAFDPDSLEILDAKPLDSGAASKPASVSGAGK